MLLLFYPKTFSNIGGFFKYLRIKVSFISCIIVSIKHSYKRTIYRLMLFKNDNDKIKKEILSFIIISY